MPYASTGKSSFLRRVEHLRKSAVPCLLVVTAFICGCEYGPENLPALYNWRDHYQAHIDAVEKKHKIEPRPPRFGLYPPDPRAQEKLAGLEREKAELKREIESRDTAWFQSLPPAEQVTWMIHQDRLSVEWARVGMEDEKNWADSQARWAEIRVQDMDRLRKLWTGDTVNLNVRNK